MRVLFIYCFVSFILYIHGIIVLKKSGIGLKSFSDMNLYEKKLSILNFLFLFLAILLIIKGLIINHNYSLYCINNGIYAEGEVVEISSEASKPNNFSVFKTKVMGHYYDVRIKYNNDQLKIHAYSEAYHNLHDIVGVYFVEDDDINISYSILYGNTLIKNCNECIDGNNTLEWGGIFLLISAFMFVIIYRIDDLFENINKT